jgi:hypothetical protein
MVLTGPQWAGQASSEVRPILSRAGLAHSLH